MSQPVKLTGNPHVLPNPAQERQIKQAQLQAQLARQANLLAMGFHQTAREIYKPLVLDYLAERTRMKTTTEAAGQAFDDALDEGELKALAAIAVTGATILHAALGDGFPEDDKEHP
jgi:hypothetical protein